MGLFSDFNPFDPANVFGGDKGDVVNNLLDPLGGFLENAGVNPWGLNELHEDTGDWMDNLADANSAMAQNRWRNWKDGEGFQRMMLSGDLYASGSPWGTKLNNEVFGRDDKPIWNTMGGKTSDDYSYAESRGEDVSANLGVDTVGTTIGNGFLNAFTFGLGSTAVNALDAYGYGDKTAGEEAIKRGAKNYAINYFSNEALDQAGASLPEMGGYTEAGGGYVGNSEFGGTGGFNLGAALDAGEYAPVVNAAAKGAVSGAGTEAIRGGNSTDIARAGLQGGAMAGVKTGGTAFMDYLGSFGSDPQTGQYMEDGTPIPYGRSNAVDQQPTAMDTYLTDSTAPQASQERPYGSTPNPGRMQALDYSLPQNLSPQTAGGSSDPFATLSNIGSAVATPNGMWPGITPGNVGNWGQVGTGLYALWKAKQMAKLGRPTGAQTAARGQMESLIRDPSSITSMPGYKAREQAITRSMAANGYLGSGNMMAELADFGGGFYNDTLRTMSGLAAPTADQQQYNIGSTQLSGQGLQSLLYGGVGLLNPKKPGG